MVSVLFVDDELSVLNALQRLFRTVPLPSYYASSAEAGLTLLEQHPIGVVVSDVTMPGMDGITFLTLVREHYPDIYRVVLTGASELSVAIKAINYCGASQFITKPWQADELRQTVAAAAAEYRTLRAMQSGKEEIYLALAHTVELKDPYTKGHCDRVADYALQLATVAGLQPPLLSHIRHGAILHDCGKIAIPSVVLNKPGNLSDEEFQQIRHHPTKGGEVARQAKLPQEVINIIQYHHERYEGGGYPEGLTGDAIPLEARIVAIADVYDALTSSRSYHTGIPPASALAVMQGMADRHFDPRLFKLFVESQQQAVLLQPPQTAGSSIESDANSSGEHQKW